MDTFCVCMCVRQRYDFQLFGKCFCKLPPYYQITFIFCLWGGINFVLDINFPWRARVCVRCRGRSNEHEHVWILTLLLGSSFSLCELLRNELQRKNQKFQETLKRVKQIMSKMETSIDFCCFPLWHRRKATSANKCDIIQ